MGEEEEAEDKETVATPAATAAYEGGLLQVPAGPEAEEEEEEAEDKETVAKPAAADWTALLWQAKRALSDNEMAEVEELSEQTRSEGDEQAAETEVQSSVVYGCSCARL